MIFARHPRAGDRKAATDRRVTERVLSKLSQMLALVGMLLATTTAVLIAAPHDAHVVGAPNDTGVHVRARTAATSNYDATFKQSTGRVSPAEWSFERGQDATGLSAESSGLYARPAPGIVAAEGATAALPKLGAKPNFTNAAEAPGKGWEWRGTGDPGSSKGSRYNPNSGESLHPDLGHPDPIGPHYDWKAPNATTYRVYPDGTVVPK